MKTLSAILDHGLVAHPNAAALVHASRSTSFAELERWSNGIARHLRDELGVRAGDRVVVLAEKAPVIVPVAIAIWKAGAVYVPLDVNNPPERARHILQRIEPRVVVSSERRLAEAQELAPEVPRLSYERAQELPARSERAVVDVTGDSPAIIIHTSGSTGYPKGAVLSHASVITYFENHNRFLRFGPESRGVCNGVFHFDVSIQDTFLPLYFGASVLFHADLFVSSVMLALLKRQRVTHLIAVSSVLELISRDQDALKRMAESELRTVVTGGEVCSPRLINNWLSTVPGLRVLYGYGPTECNSLCTTNEITQPELGRTSVYSIGKPFAGMRAVLLDDVGAVIEQPNTPGVLAMAGPQLMSGYFRDPEQTAQAFRTIDGERFYVTGDRCLRDEHGDYHFVGRSDSEVKIRGRRINLSEVRNALLAHAQVNYAAVGALELAGDTRIIAFVQVDEPSSFPEQELQRELERRVPSYMLPSNICLGAQVEKTSTDKVSDRKMIERARAHVIAAPDTRYIRES